MPAYTTIDEMKGFAPPLNEQRSRTKAFASKAEKNTFLSHSSKDDELVPGTVRILENHGGQVYVDHGDDRLEVTPGIETAQVLRNTLRQMRKFVLLVSANSKGSIWIPWELGLADGEKGVSAIALFPVVGSVTEVNWAEQEYLGLYSRIVWGDLKGHDRPLWMVYDIHKNTAVSLSKWLQAY